MTRLSTYFTIHILGDTMSAFGGDSPLSDAPSSNSAARSTTSSPTKSSTPPLKSKKKPVKAESASSSRRSSRIEDRPQSPEKLTATGPAPSIKIKFTRPSSPEKSALNEIPEEAGLDKEKEIGKRGKRRKSDAGGAEEELREAIGSGKGKKKVKVTHGEEEDEPRKKNVAIKKKSLTGVGSGVAQTQSQSATDLISGMFTDDDDDDDIGDGVKEKEEVVKPVIKIKGKPGRKPKVDRDQDGDVKMGGEVDEERPSKSSKSSDTKAARRVEEGTEIQANPIEPNPIGNTESTPPSTSTSKSKSQSKKTKRDATEVQLPSADETAEGEKHVPGSNPAPKARGRPKKVHAETSTVDAKAAPPLPAPAPVDIVSKQTKEESKELASDPTANTAADTVKPKKSFAQVVAGSPPLDPKKERKPLPTIQKLTKSVSGGTPDKRVTSVGSTTSGPGTGTSTPTTKKMVPIQKKKEVSLLESTMASLLGGGSKSTPKKEVSSPCFVLFLPSI